MTPRSIDYHRTDCPCPACRSAHGITKIQKAFRLKKETLAQLSAVAQETGLHQNEIIEEALRLFWQVFPRKECICGEEVRAEVYFYCPNHPHPYEVGSESSHARSSNTIPTIERRSK